MNKSIKTSLSATIGDNKTASKDRVPYARNKLFLIHPIQAVCLIPVVLILILKLIDLKLMIRVRLTKIMSKGNTKRTNKKLNSPKNR